MSVEKTVKITNERGLHARAAAKFVKTVEQFDAKITVSHVQLNAPGDSIMELLMLGAHNGVEITIIADGSDADRAIDVLCNLVSDKFGENR